MILDALYVSSIRVSQVRDFQSLRKYDAGEVKEGVGAGDTTYAAAMLGITQSEILGCG